jgi:hypothetical protein
VDGEDEGRIHGSKSSHGCGKTGDHQRLLGDDARERWCGEGKSAAVVTSPRGRSSWSARRMARCMSATGGLIIGYVPSMARNCCSLLVSMA